MSYQHLKLKSTFTSSRFYLKHSDNVWSWFVQKEDINVSITMDLHFLSLCGHNNWILKQLLPKRAEILWGGKLWCYGSMIKVGSPSLWLCSFSSMLEHIVPSCSTSTYKNIAFAAKSGIDPSDCVQLAKHIKLHCPNLSFSGLMTIGMPDYTSTPENFRVIILYLQ